MSLCRLAVLWTALLPASVPAWGDAAEGGSEVSGAVTRAELLAYLSDPTTFVLLDARSASEFVAGHVAGAANVPHEKIDAYKDVLPGDRQVPVVVYCRTGRRAASLASGLRARGYTNVRVLAPEQMFWSDNLVVFNCSDSAGPAHAKRAQL